MNFQQSLEYLLSLGNEVLAMKLGLNSTEKLLAALGNPEQKILKVQVAGTNGKGSTCAFLDAICRRAQIKTGLFTSPHLISITERIKINGASISETDFAGHATRIREISEKLVEENELEAVPTFFEQMTAIAVSVFAEAEIELAILETGLGGRFDSVTATRAEIVAITPIDYDHQQILGNTLAEIAFEKAAIIRADTRVIVAPQKHEALQVILTQCKKTAVLPLVNECEYSLENSPEVSFKTRNQIYPNIRVSLEGEHQNQNACVAINLAEILSKDFGFEISFENIVNGLENTEHKGRLEWWEGKQTRVLFDGAHNIAGALALKNYLQQKETENTKITIVFGTMRDKDLADIAAIVFPIAETLILTKPDNPRSADVKELQKIAKKFVDKSKIFMVPDVAAAINSAKQITATYSATKNSFICITGSIYLVGEAQKLLNNDSEF